MAKIVHFEVTTEAERSRLLEGVDAEVEFSEEPFSERTAYLASDALAISGFVRSRFSKAALARLPKLEIVATRSTGYDHIDLEACRARGIAVANVPYYGENTVAEHTFALMLSLARKLPHALERTRRGDFASSGLTGFDLKDKTLGVIGAGSIGLHVIRIARGFGMRVVAHDTREQHLLAEVLGFDYVTLEELLARSDVISLHVPALVSTRHLMNRERIFAMKKGALVVNTARGSVVDTDALLEALEAGHLGGVGLDVIEGEEHLGEDLGLLARPENAGHLREVARDRRLLERRDVIFTPHMAFDSREARARILETTRDNLEAFFSGRPRNLVSSS